MNDTDTRKAALRPVLWLVLILSAAANATTSMLGLGAVSAGLGVVALGSAAALIVHHYRNRRPAGH